METIRSRDFLHNLLFSDSDIDAICSHPRWTEQHLAAELKKILDEGLCREDEILAEFKQDYPNLLRWYNGATDIDFLSCFKPLTAFEEKDPEWLIPYAFLVGRDVDSAVRFLYGLRGWESPPSRRELVQLRDRYSNAFSSHRPRHRP